MPGPFARPLPPAAHFPVGGPVPSGDLVGRDAFLRGIVSRLEDGTHLLVSGPRRIGKTSLVLEALRRLRRRGALTAYVDCLGVTDLRALAERLAEAVLEPVTGTPRSLERARLIVGGARPTGRLRLDDWEPALAMVRETSVQRVLDAALDVPRLVAARTGKRVVVALDEFQAAGRLGPKVFDTMRARFQGQRGVTFVFLGSEQGVLEALFGEKGRAFYRFAIPQDLVGIEHRFGIDPADWATYLRAKFAEKKLAIGDAEIDELLDATGGHPQDTMQVCAALLYLLRELGERSVSSRAVALAYEQALRELERPFALHWADLGTQKYLQQIAKRIAHGAVLYAVAGEGDVPRPEVLRALESLQARGLVARLGRGRYEFIEPMLAEYVRRLDEGLPAIVGAR